MWTPVHVKGGTCALYKGKKREKEVKKKRKRNTCKGSKGKQREQKLNDRRGKEQRNGKKKLTENAKPPKAKPLNAKTTKQR